MTFVCPRCRTPLEAGDGGYRCALCASDFPIVAGIPDFRLAPDPYIGIVDDRRKAERLFAQGATGTFEDLLRHYYAITPEDPADLAARWIPRALAEPDIAAALLVEYGFLPAVDRPASRTAEMSPRGPLLDVGCSTGGLLVAAHDAFAPLVGVDVALRWLAVGRVRLREAGIDATLVCANAEHLPFADGSFAAIACTDTLEHVTDAAGALREMRRVSAHGGRLLATANNRFAPLPEPNIHLWGVAQLPRAWQSAYVKRRRGDLHPYQIQLRGAGELQNLATAAGFDRVKVAAGPLFAPHAGAGLRRLLGVYNRARSAPIIASLLRLAGPKLVLRADATASSRPSP